MHYQQTFARWLRSNLKTFVQCPSIETSYTVCYMVLPETRSLKCFFELK